MSGNEKSWFVVYTRPRWEKKVYGLMTERGLESYCPLNRTRKKWSDRIKWVDEPLFKSYVFVKIREEEATAVRMISGVVNFVYWLGKPAVVREKEIAIIRKFLNEYKEVRAEPLTISPDARLRVKGGIFMDQEVKVLQVQGNRVRVIIESIGYSLIASIDRSNLTPIV